MNITPIKNFGLFNPNKTQNYNEKASVFGIKMAEPLKQDMVSFKSTSKLMLNKKAGLTMKDCIKIHEFIQPRQKRVHNFIARTFAKHLTTEFSPNNILIEMADISKKPGSIWEKANTNEWDNIDKVLTNMTDLNRAKLVLRTSKPEEVNKIYDDLIDAVMKRKVEIVEVEQKRPKFVKTFKNKEKYDYGTSSKLNELCEVASKKQGEDVVLNEPVYTDTNYVATHFLLRFPGQNWVFELQIMGCNVAHLKNLDDLLFKLLNGKNIHPAYKPIVEIIKPISKRDEFGELLYPEQYSNFNRYRADAFKFQREKPSRLMTPGNSKEYFLPLNCDLPDEFDLNNLMELKVQCDTIRDKMYDKMLSDAKK